MPHGVAAIGTPLAPLFDHVVNVVIVVAFVTLYCRYLDTVQCTYIRFCCHAIAAIVTPYDRY